MLVLPWRLLFCTEPLNWAWVTSPKLGMVLDPVIVFSAAVGNKGFSINGSSGSSKDMSASSCWIWLIVEAASSKGFASPILAAFSAKAFLTSV